jgi:DNA-binding NarL/FixJ family response regulator
MPIKVSIVEDSRGTRESLTELLGRAPGLCCVGGHANGEEALRAIPAENPDVVLMDINLPGMSGIECVARLKGLLPQLQMLMITTYEETDLIFRSLRAGAKGYLLKNMPPAELIQAIGQVYAGGAPMSMRIARKVVDYFDRVARGQAGTESLTKREQEVLALLAKGCLYKEISDQLGIGLGTVQTYVKHIYEKLHVQSRAGAAAKFFGLE